MNMKSKYLDIICNIIEGRVKNDKDNMKNITLSQVNNLLCEIQDSINTVIKIYGYPELDQTTMDYYFELAKRQYLSVNPIIEVHYTRTEIGKKPYVRLLNIKVDFDTFCVQEIKHADSCVRSDIYEHCDIERGDKMLSINFYNKDKKIVENKFFSLV